jgi:hypothetical protein
MLRHSDVVSVSKQMGHANPNVTLAVYAHVLGTEEEQADRGAEIAPQRGSATDRPDRCARDNLLSPRNRKAPFPGLS